MKKFARKLFLAAILSSFVLTGYSQCKGFTRKNCVPNLDPYIYNGQVNSTILNEGDIAELMLTFYANQDYRIFVCAEENLSDLQFKLMDRDRNVIFNNKDHDFIQYWDFSSKATQQLIVEVIVPETDSKNPEIESGCVSILVGFMDQ